jgi:DNA-binding NtrC family response regulator
MSGVTSSMVPAGQPPLRLVGDICRVLIVGADSARRAALLDGLTQTMPEGTTFAEADTLAETLERAPASEIVILAGALDHIPARSLARLLAARHPGLRVVGLGAR